MGQPITKKNMEFYTPDERWDIFGCPDFESFLNKYLVRGNFHKKVPEQVVDAYKTIEYLMAHAYYYYPMYDEALSKLLRTIEMAIKIRCKELNIPTVVEKKKGNEIKRYDLTFNDLINKVCNEEKEKKLDFSLHRIREIRNMFMHPEFNSYMGGIIIFNIYFCVTILNTLFADKSFFIKVNSELKSFENKLANFKAKTMTFKRGSEYFLIHDLEIIDFFYIENEDLFCFSIHPVIQITENIILEKKVTGAPPICFPAKDVKISENSILGIDIKNNISFKIDIIDSPEDQRVMEKYKEYINRQESFHLNIAGSEIVTAITRFRYEYYHLIH